MGAVKADLSSSSGHVTYKGQAVVSLHRLLTEAKTSQVLCTEEVQRRCGMPLPPARAVSHARVSSSRPLRHHNTPQLLLPSHIAPLPQRAASHLADDSTDTATAASHSAPGFTTGLRPPCPLPSRLHETQPPPAQQHYEQRASGHSTAGPRLSPLSRSVLSASAYSTPAAETTSDISQDPSMCDASVQSNPVTQAIATEAPVHGSASAPGVSTQAVHLNVTGGSDHGGAGADTLHTMLGTTAAGQQHGLGQSQDAAVAGEGGILCEELGEESQIESFQSQVVFFQLAPMSNAARGWAGLTSTAAEGGPTYQCR